MTVSKLKVVAMPTGWLTVDRSSQIYGRYYGQQIKVPVWSTAIVGGDKKIVVDTGIHDPGGCRASSVHVSRRRKNGSNAR